MLGAIIGDIVGSIYEFESDKTKDFELFTEESRLTDDSMMTIAVGCACAKADLNAVALGYQLIMMFSNGNTTIDQRDITVDMTGDEDDGDWDDL